MGAPLQAAIDPSPAHFTSPLQSLFTPSNITEDSDFLNLHAQLRIVFLLTLLSLLPLAIFMMTSFTRILIIFHFLRQAVGTPQMPSNSVIMGLSLILTLFIMHPVIEEIRSQALLPYIRHEFAQHPDVQMHLRGEDAIFFEKVWNPLRNFLLHHTREKDMQLFLDFADIEIPLVEALNTASSSEKMTMQAHDLSVIPWYCLLPAFILSELRAAFMVGFLLFIPFIVIDMVVSSILMSMGMMMLPPAMISLPFKILLFVMIDGWRLVIERVIKSFFPTW